MSFHSGSKRVALYLLLGGLLALGGCHWRRTPGQVEKLLNDNADVWAKAKNYPGSTYIVTYSHCREGDPQWDYVCDKHVVPDALTRARRVDPKILDETTGVRISESCYGPGVAERPLSQRWTPAPK